MDIIPDIFSDVCEQDSDRELLQYRDRDGEWTHMTVEDFEDAVKHRAKRLHEAGVEPDSSIALISENRPEWHLYDFAILGLGASTVPIHANMSPEQTGYVLRDSESTHLIVSNEKLLTKVKKGLDGMGDLKRIIVLDPASEYEGEVVVGEEKFLDNGSSRDADHSSFWEQRVSEVRPDDLATLIYTSGTTGDPKGVMLTHHNLVTNIASSHEVVQFREDDLGLSFLPLSHAFERMVDYAYFYCGSRIAYGSPDTITEDLKEVQPTIMASVPRLFEKMKNKVESRLADAGFLRRTLFRWATNAGYQATAQYRIEGKPLDPWLRFKRWLANTLILRPIRSALGGNLRMAVSGGAALDESVCRFFLSLSVPILEGYGMTEMSPVVALNRPREIRPGTVGKPVPNVEVKLNENGEILCRGPNMMKGYYRKYEESVEALRDGWFHTGDLGEFDEEGNLKIKGRAKYSIITSWGENIVPQPLEQELRQSRFVEHAVLLGHNRNFVSALIQVDFDEVQKWAENRDLSFGPRRELVRLEPVRELIREEVDEIQSDWAEYEQIKEFRLLPEKLTVKKGDLTPTMKIRRHVLKEKFGDLVEEMYQGEGDEDSETEEREEETESTVDSS